MYDSKNFTLTPHILVIFDSKNDRELIEILFWNITSQIRNNMEKKTEQTLHNHIDFKDIVRLAASINPHARMMNRRRTGFTAKGQRNFATAIKRARFMALMPYIKH